MAKTLEEQIAVMQGFADGKKIECKSLLENEDLWEEIKEPKWNWNYCDYRIKEEPKYRPYKDTEELINDFCKRFGIIISDMPKFILPCIWVRSKTPSWKGLIVSYTKDFVTFGDGDVGRSITVKDLLERFTFLDDSPCGVEI